MGSVGDGWTRYTPHSLRFNPHRGALVRHFDGNLLWYVTPCSFHPVPAMVCPLPLVALNAAWIVYVQKQCYWTDLKISNYSITCDKIIMMDLGWWHAIEES